MVHCMERYVNLFSFVLFCFVLFCFVLFYFLLLKGGRYINALDEIRDLYCTYIRDGNFCNKTFAELQNEFEGNRYKSKSLLNYFTVKRVIKAIETSYVRKKWKLWKLIYYEKQISEFNLDATFGLCSKLYQYKEGIWHKLKLSFAHIQDALGFIPAALLLANASESHDKILDFISDVFVECLKLCKEKRKEFKIYLGTDASKRDCNVPDKILPYIYKKLNLENETNKIFTNKNGITFNFNDFEVVV